MQNPSTEVATSLRIKAAIPNQAVLLLSKTPTPLSCYKSDRGLIPIHGSRSTVGPSCTTQPQMHRPRLEVVDM